MMLDSAESHKITPSSIAVVSMVTNMFLPVIQELDIFGINTIDFLNISRPINSQNKARKSIVVIFDSHMRGRELAWLK